MDVISKRLLRTNFINKINIHYKLRILKFNMSKIAFDTNRFKVKWNEILLCHKNKIKEVRATWKWNYCGCVVLTSVPGELQNQ